MAAATKKTVGIGGGKLFFQESDGDGGYLEEREIGLVTSMSFSASAEVLKIWDSGDGPEKLFDSATTSQSLSGSFETQNMLAENVMMSLFSDSATETFKGSIEVADGAVIPSGYTNTTGSDVDILVPDGSTKVDGTLNEAGSDVSDTVPSGSAFPDGCKNGTGDTLGIQGDTLPDGTVAAADTDINRLDALSKEMVAGRLRFVRSPVKGKKWVFHFLNVTISPSGDTSLVSPKDASKLAFSFECQEDDSVTEGSKYLKVYEMES